MVKCPNFDDEVTRPLKLMVGIIDGHSRHMMMNEVCINDEVNNDE